ncbi:MAG TPA: DNA topoisomerase IB [Methylomirabilota bacterium]|nr:DNA topoisomerase IB [Methylomirabilota bacterium]
MARLRGLAIPPAWRDVWICPGLRGHIQATGRDARGRKQYRYHARWRAIRDATKFDRLVAFATALPRIRAVTDRHLARRGLPREKVLATVVRLLESTLIRVGNPEYARHNKSFGLTTLHNRHVDVLGSTVRFQFRGKGGRSHEVDVSDRRLAGVVARCQELPGQELFQYLDAQGRPVSIDSSDVNGYLRRITGQEITAKDFRTWTATVLAAMALADLARFESTVQARRNVLRAVATVAARLGNTAAICRKSYVHPVVIDAYLQGSLLDQLAVRTEKASATTLRRLRPEEAAVLALLQQRTLRQPAELAKAA